MIFGNGARLEKSKGKYKFLSNLIYHYKNLAKWEPKLFWIGILLVIPMILESVLGNALPSVMVAGLEQGWDLSSYMGTLILLILSLWLCGLIQSAMSSYCYNSRAIYRAHYSKPYVEKKMRVDFDILENKDFQTHSNATYTAIYQGRGIDDATYKLPHFLAFLGPVVVFGILLARVSIWIPLLAIICALVQVKLLKLARSKHSEWHPQLSDLSRKMAYLTSQTRMHGR